MNKLIGLKPIEATKQILCFCAQYPDAAVNAVALEFGITPADVMKKLGCKKLHVEVQEAGMAYLVPAGMLYMLAKLPPSEQLAFLPKARLNSHERIATERLVAEIVAKVKELRDAQRKTIPSLPRFYSQEKFTQDVEFEAGGHGPMIPIYDRKQPTTSPCVLVRSDYVNEVLGKLNRK